MVDRKTVFLGHRADFSEARVLVPAAALIEIREREEACEEDEEFGAGSERHWGNDQ